MVDIVLLVSCIVQITEKCLSSIFKLQHLEDLVLEGCYGIDDDSLNHDVFKQGCKTLKVYVGMFNISV